MCDFCHLSLVTCQCVATPGIEPETPCLAVALATTRPTKQSLDTMWEVFATLAPLEALVQPSVIDNIITLIRELAPKAFCPLRAETENSHRYPSISQTNENNFLFCSQFSDRPSFRVVETTL
ncbi:hypothetical protein SFRURICE_015387 [Spodoptera frugiperda]|nr:hypothetical protein SFRURICE_015387 [Spodoptera frugiperda]